MSLLFLLDTNIVSTAFKPSPPAVLLDRLRRNDGRMAICAPVWHELLFGCSRLPVSRKRDALEHFLREVIEASMPILPYDSKAAAHQAAERTRLTALGRPPPFVDAQIAAIARTNELTLVTANTADFRAFEGLVIENWLE